MVFTVLAMEQAWQVLKYPASSPDLLASNSAWAPGMMGLPHDSQAIISKVRPQILRSFFLSSNLIVFVGQMWAQLRHPMQSGGGCLKGMAIRFPIPRPEELMASTPLTAQTRTHSPQRIHVVFRSDSL